MTALALDIERPAMPDLSTTRDRLTLDDVIVGAWEELHDHHTVTCPVCSGAMAPRYGAGSTPVGGRCADCGSTLG